MAARLEFDYLEHALVHPLGDCDRAPVHAGQLRPVTGVQTQARVLLNVQLRVPSRCAAGDGLLSPQRAGGLQ